MEYEKIERFSTLEPDIDPLTPVQEDLLKSYLDHVMMTRSLREHVSFTFFSMMQSYWSSSKAWRVR